MRPASGLHDSPKSGEWGARGPGHQWEGATPGRCVCGELRQVGVVQTWHRYPLQPFLCRPSEQLVPFTGSDWASELFPLQPPS